MSRDVAVSVHMDEQMADDLDRLLLVEKASSRNELILRVLSEFLYGRSRLINLLQAPVSEQSQSDASRTGRNSLPRGRA